MIWFGNKLDLTQKQQAGPWLGRVTFYYKKIKLFAKVSRITIGHFYIIFDCEKLRVSSAIFTTFFHQFVDILGT